MDKSEIINANYAEFVSALEKEHLQNLTGCIFFTSNINRSGQLFLTNGELVNVSYAYKRGKQALELMTEIKLVKYRVGKQRVEAKIDPSLPATPDIISYLKSHATGGNAKVDAQPFKHAAIALSTEQKSAIEQCMLEIIGPMADLIAEEHVYKATSLQEALTGIKEDIDNKTFAELKAAIDNRISDL